MATNDEYIYIYDSLGRKRDDVWIEKKIILATLVGKSDFPPEGKRNHGALPISFFFFSLTAL